MIPKAKDVQLVLFNMATTVIDFWSNLNRKHPNKVHGIYKATQLYDVPKVPGIYSWHINTTELNFKDYFKVFKQKKINVNLSGNLKEKYLGEIRNVYHDKDFNFPSTDYSLCEFASFAFCPPMYIGISVNLHSRLNDHYRELEKIHFGKVKLGASKKLDRTRFDTIFESQHFAQRLGHTLVDLKNLKLDSVFIKTIELDVGYAKSELHKVEKYLNRTFIPLYGRR